VRCSVLQVSSVQQITPQRVAVCCSALQCVAVCCSVLQWVAVCKIVLQCAAVGCRVLQCVAVCYNALQCVVKLHYFLFEKHFPGANVLQCVAVWCTVLHLQKTRRHGHVCLEQTHRNGV